MRSYFSIRSQAAMKILGILMEAGVWGTLGTLIVNPSLQESLKFYMTPDMVTFMLSGLIINRLVEMAQLFQPFFFRSNYKVYHNRPFNLWIVAFASNLDSTFFWGLTSLVIYILVATFVFKVHINLLSGAFWLVILIGALYRLGLNLVTAGWTMVTKSLEDPITWFFSNTSRLFTGELIPITVLPPLLRFVSGMHPKTYVQTLGRQTAVGGATVVEILPRVWTLLFASTVFLALGILTFKVCVSRAKREGTLKWG